MNKIRPVRDMILVKKNDVTDKTAGGIYIPQNVDSPNYIGTVVAVGSGHLTTTGKIIPLEVKVDDEIAFDKRNATEIEIKGEKFFLLKEGNVNCII